MEKNIFFHISEDGYESAEPCECLIAKWTENWLRHSGIDYEEYQTKNLGTFFTDCEMAEKMKDNAVKFLADKEATGWVLPREIRSRQNPYMYRYFPGANKRKSCRINTLLTGRRSKN